MYIFHVILYIETHGCCTYILFYDFHTYFIEILWYCKFMIWAIWPLVMKYFHLLLETLFHVMKNIPKYLRNLTLDNGIFPSFSSNENSTSTKITPKARAIWPLVMEYSHYQKNLKLWVWKYSTLWFMAKR